jgi:hypothetical protein
VTCWCMHEPSCVWLRRLTWSLLWSRWVVAPVGVAELPVAVQLLLLCCTYPRVVDLFGGRTVHRVGASYASLCSCIALGAGWGWLCRALVFLTLACSGRTAYAFTAALMLQWGRASMVRVTTAREVTRVVCSSLLCSDLPACFQLCMYAHSVAAR